MAGGIPLRGYTTINRLLKERVVQPDGFELGQYLGEAESVAEPAQGRLLSLLGTYVGAGTDAQFQNGQPNSMNMILWYILLDHLADGVAANCPGAHPGAAARVRLRPRFAEALRRVCAWPSPDAKTPEALRGLWLELTAFDAPDQEFEAWRGFFVSSPDYVRAPASRAVSALVLSALFNPYFLLRD
jgi:hypothetical protein